MKRRPTEKQLDNLSYKIFGFLSRGTRLRYLTPKEQEHLVYMMRYIYLKGDFCPFKLGTASAGKERVIMLYLGDNMVPLDGNSIMLLTFNFKHLFEDMQQMDKQIKKSRLPYLKKMYRASLDSIR